jgi:dephospho-CoA kinase
MNYPKPAQEHYLIGLTGNIGSGKSMVRQLLEYLGALGIDADWLARQASLRGSPAYPAIVRRFGQEILGEDGEIDRKKLAGIVFTDVQALKELETIIYPPVFNAIDTLIERSPLPVVVIEAIKLLEGDLAKRCRSIWVVEADEQVVFQRLQSYRGMRRAEAEQRLANQSDTAQKISQADVVIHNSGSLGETWHQILSASNALADAPLLPPDFVELGSRLGLLTPAPKTANGCGNFEYTRRQSAGCFSAG